jgi:hypothetical protein
MESAWAAALLILGAMILLLSAAWQYLRRLLMIAIPPHVALRLPPTKTLEIGQLKDTP